MLRIPLRLHDAITEVGFWIGSVSTAYLTLVTAWEVFGRYVLRSPSDIAPDTAAVAFAMIVFLSAPQAARYMTHARMNLLHDFVRQSVAVWLDRLVYMVGILVCGLCTWFAIAEVMRNASLDVMMITVTPIPKWVVTAPIAYCFGSMTLYFIRFFLATFTHAEN